MSDSSAPPAIPGLRVLQRGWLSSNNILLDAGPGQAVLVDSGHTVHAAQTVALVRQELQGRHLIRVINTHLHSDHCGGNAALQRAFGCSLATPSGHYQAALAWDEKALSYRDTGQTCERFSPDESLVSGQVLEIGSRRWQVLATGGHDPHAVVLFDEAAGLLISADTLWENGFGVIFPELDGIDAFAEEAAVLDLIEALNPRWVIPGHGAPFGDVVGALARARSRLDGFRADPARHHRHAMRVLVKYHLMEVQQMSWATYVDWFEQCRLAHSIWALLKQPDGSVRDWAVRLAQELVASGALGADEDLLFDKP